MDLDRPEKRRRITTPPPAAGVTLPDDLLFMEVLVRLDVKFLVRSKCVCRSWRARMEDTGFIRRHSDFSRASPPSMLVVRACRNASLGDDDVEILGDVTFYRLRPGQKPGDFEAKAELLLEKAPACPPESGDVTDVIHTTHCDGLVAVATTTNQVFVCNPATKELVALPIGSGNLNLDYAKHPSAAIGFDRWRNQYVVSRYFYRRLSYDDSRCNCKLDYDIGHEVFTLGGDSWELTADPPHAIGGTPPVCTGDAFYWVCEAAEDPRPSSLLRFSLRDRTFDPVPCPPNFGYHPAIDHLAELDGKLCYVNSASLTTFDVWQLADADETRPAQWSLRCRIDQGPAYDEDFATYGLLPLWAAGGGMLAKVSDGDEKLYWCHEKRPGVEEVVDLEEVGEEEDADSEEDANNYVYHVVPYRESLVSISKSKV
jgi:F-box interacting protein